MTIKTLLVAGLTALTLMTTPSVWAGNVSWSITVGSGGNGHYRPHYVRPRPVVVVHRPRPVYHRPRPVVVHRPVYHRPRPVVVYHPRPVVVVHRPRPVYHRPRPVVTVKPNYHRGHYQRARYSNHGRSHKSNYRLY